MTSFVSIRDPLQNKKKPIRVLADEAGKLDFEYNAEDHSRAVAQLQASKESEAGLPNQFDRTNTMADMHSLMLDDAGTNTYGLQKMTPEEGETSAGGGEENPVGEGSEASSQASREKGKGQAGWGNVRLKMLKEKEDMISAVVAANNKAKVDAAAMEDGLPFKMRMRYTSPTIKRDPTRMTVKF